LLLEKIVYENGQLNPIQGSGKYIETACFNEYVYQKLIKREQLIKQQKVEREPYTGEVIETNKSISNGDLKLHAKNPANHDLSASGFHNRPATRAGVRNLFDSSFMLSGEQWDDGNLRKTTRVQQPPGGQSKGLWDVEPNGFS